MNENGSRQCGSLNKSPQSIIVLTREFIGDLVCTTPALRSLRRLYPSARITVEVGDKAACVLTNNPNVDELVLRPHHQGLSGKVGFVLWMRKKRFDLAVVMDLTADMGLYVWLAGIPERVAVRNKRRFTRLLTCFVPFDPASHEMIDNFRNVVKLLGGDTTDATPELFPSEEDILEVAQVWRQSKIQVDRPVVALNPGASAASNRWLTERFASVGDRLSSDGIQVVLLGGSQDADLAAAIRGAMRTEPVTLTGRFSVLQLANAISRCDIMVTGDTGPMHIACAVGTPVVAVFGPAKPYETGPLYVAGNTVIRAVSECPNCTKHICREGRRCMELVTADEVADAVLARLVELGRWNPVSATDPDAASPSSH